MILDWISFIFPHFSQLVPRSHGWYRLLSATAPGAGETAAKPKTDASSSVKPDVVSKQDVAVIKEKPALDLPSEEEGFVERFIPISRRSLVRELMEEDFLLESEKKQFEKFATALDAAIVNQYHGNLAELKVSQSGCIILCACAVNDLMLVCN